MPSSLTSPPPSAFSTDPSVGPKPMRQFIAMNYFSLGMDALIATTFDSLRKKHPSLFNSRLMNKAWYGTLGLYGWAQSDRLDDSVYFVDVATEEGILEGDADGANGSNGVMMSNKERLRLRRRAAEKRRQARADAVKAMKHSKKMAAKASADGAPPPAPPREKAEEEGVDEDIARALDASQPQPQCIGAKPITLDDDDSSAPSDSDDAAAWHSSDDGGADEAAYIPIPKATPVALPSRTKCLVLSNVGSYSGGAKLWAPGGGASRAAKAAEARRRLIGKIRTGGGAAGNGAAANRTDSLSSPADADGPTSTTSADRLRCPLSRGGNGDDDGVVGNSSGVGSSQRYLSCPFAGLSEAEEALLSGASEAGFTGVSTSDGRIEMTAVGGLADMMMLQSKLSPASRMAQSQVVRIVVGHPQHHPRRVAEKIAALADEVRRKEKLLSQELEPTARTVAIAQYQSRVREETRKAVKLAKKQKDGQRDRSGSAGTATTAVTATTDATGVSTSAAVAASASPYLDPSQKATLLEQHYAAIMTTDRDIVAIRERIETIKALLEVMPDWAIHGGDATSTSTAAAGNGIIASSSASAPSNSAAVLGGAKALSAIKKHRPATIEAALAAAIHSELPTSDLVPAGALGSGVGFCGGEAGSAASSPMASQRGMGSLLLSSPPTLSLNKPFDQSVCFQVDGEPSGFVTEPSLIEVRPYPKQMLVRSIAHLKK